MEADFPGVDARDGPDDVAGDDAAAGGEGDAGAMSVTRTSCCRLAGECWESESSKWTPV